MEVGKLADLVLWKPAFFGAKPSFIIKGGMIVAAPMGDPNASIPTPQPVHYRPMFAALGSAASYLFDFYVGQCHQGRVPDQLKLGSMIAEVTVVLGSPRPP